MNKSFDDSKKYIIFKKRVEKYKARGFTFTNEEEIIKEVKFMLNIRYKQQNTDRILEILKTTEHDTYVNKLITNYCKDQGITI